mmetsp:Transcript_6786/g.20666  ORF Transcript_6786/g.20666 Transcript_6786/m.20666 type:complete len:224 (-) Transcript_6786:1517-2188(-)
MGPQLTPQCRGSTAASARRCCTSCCCGSVSTCCGHTCICACASVYTCTSAYTCTCTSVRHYGTSSCSGWWTTATASSRPGTWLRSGWTATSTATRSCTRLQGTAAAAATSRWRSSSSSRWRAAAASWCARSAWRSGCHAEHLRSEATQTGTVALECAACAHGQGHRLRGDGCHRTAPEGGRRAPGEGVPDARSKVARLRDLACGTRGWRRRRRSRRGPPQDPT